jgi:hypothetical protein
MNKEITRWLRTYENKRTNPYSDCKLPACWHSSKFDLENMDWDSMRELYIPELDCKFGGACMALKKQQ